MSYRMLGLLALIGTLILGLVGCGPMYRTEYRYTPPASMEGRQCVVQCANIREVCRSGADTRAAQNQSSCQQNVFMQYTSCMTTARSDEERAKCSNSTTHCQFTPDTSRCDSDYNICFQTCGGQVETRQVCVSGC